MKWFLGALLVLLAALVLETGLLAYAMYVLLGVMLLSRFLARSWIESLSATRRCDCDSAEIGDEVEVTLVVRNSGALPVPWVLLEDMLPARALLEGRARLRVRRKRMKLALIWARGATMLSYGIEFRMRGYYQIGPLVLESGDLFGLHRRYRLGAEPHFVLVYPQVVPLEGYDLASRRPVGEVRLTHRLYEDPTRIAGVRHYEQGDPLNRVHWRATARTGALHSKIYEPSVIAGLTVLLDFHQASYPSRGEPFRSELAVTTAASLMHAVYQLGQQVGLVTNGRDAADRIRQEGWAHDYRTREEALKSAAVDKESDRLQPLVVETRRGPEQLQRILEALARVELTDGLTVPQLVVETASRLPRDATVAAILGEVTAETALALGNLRRRGYAVVAILVIFGEEQQEEAAGRLLAEGIEVRDVRDEASLAAVCRQQVLR
ncbi:MAG: DUF58 domain-containing protein [Gemmataceae bacterium]|nr:DUF58 domain-containing protein [Gemmataceae bacterium]